MQLQQKKEKKKKKKKKKKKSSFGSIAKVHNLDDNIPTSNTLRNSFVVGADNTFVDMGCGYPVSFKN